MSLRKKIAEWIYPGYDVSYRSDLKHQFLLGASSGYEDGYRHAQENSSGYLKGHEKGLDEGYNAHKKEIADMLEPTEKFTEITTEQAAQLINGEIKLKGPFRIKKKIELDSNDGIYKWDDKGCIEKLIQVEVGHSLRELLLANPKIGDNVTFAVKPKRKYTKKTEVKKRSK